MLDENRMRELSCFQKTIGITFNDSSLLDTAFTHTSYANERGPGVENNEKLEFLGDSILGFVAADYLFNNYTNLHEGDFSRIKATVVSEESLSEVALRLDFPRYIRIGRGEEINGGRSKKALLADAMEAVIAAIYLDQGIEVAGKYIISWLKDQISKVFEGKNTNKDYKSVLQEYLQKKSNKVPEYKLDHVEGPQHDQRFFFKVFVGNKCFGPAEGKNKKEAEQNAARLAIDSLGLSSSFVKEGE